ncbi:hypothetical protein TrST_g2494 [Triparma strigata]|uniref:sphinganine-1-phosphate aldolase n=1 Tax=Triparma strigata TaxID=1606541 RepID=A0A9W7E411_9STRA|nr:hypothetical protein TrST_g2494 [Triparma strigata]
MTSLRSLIIDVTNSYISTRLASHFSRSLGSDTEVISTILIAGIGSIVLLKIGPAKSVAIRTFRNATAPICTAVMAYRAITVLFPSIAPFKVEHDLFDYVVSALHYIYTVMEHYSSLHLPSLLSSSLMTLFRDLVGLAIIRMIVTYGQSIRRTSFSELKKDIIESSFQWAKNTIPSVAKELQKEEDKMEVDLEESLKDSTRTRTLVIPPKGRTSRSLLLDLKKRGKVENRKWEDGLVSGAVYCGEKDHTDLLNAAYAAFSLANPLHPDIWPSVNQFEAEICSMTASLMNGTLHDLPLDQIVNSVVGCLSSGGTESIILAAKAHREYYCKRRGIKHPEIISCTTAHAAIDKACEILCCRNVKIPYDPDTYALDIDALEAAITSDTILLYSSAPTFPQGVVDPIKKLSDLAVKHDVGLHVDCCLGGFVLPFAKKLGYPVPEFDFTLQGVTSMSCDTHKYGYASKGTSVVLYRNKELRRCQYFCYPEWTGGLYVTPTIAGSRPGALSAACWASMMAMGEDGYSSRVSTIMDATQEIASAVASMPGLYLLGSPKSMIVCFDSKDFNIYRVGDKMTKMGWSLNSLQKPACIHLCVTLRTVEHKDKFIDDLSQCVDEVVFEGNDGALTGNAAIYGMSGSMPPGPINELLKCYTDTILKA